MLKPPMERTARRATRLGNGLLALGLVMAGLASAPAAEIGDVEVKLAVEEGRLSIRFEQAVPLRDLLLAIGAEAGIKVSATGDLGLAQPRVVERRPLAEVIRTLAGDHSLLMIFGRSAEANGQERLSKVVIYAATPAAERERARAEAAARRPAPTSTATGPLSDDTADRIRELAGQGLSPGEISQRVGTPVNRIQRYLRTIKGQN